MKRQTEPKDIKLIALSMVTPRDLMKIQGDKSPDFYNKQSLGNIVEIKFSF